MIPLLRFFPPLLDRKIINLEGFCFLLLLPAFQLFLFGQQLLRVFLACIFQPKANLVLMAYITLIKEDFKMYYLLNYPELIGFYAKKGHQNNYSVCGFLCNYLLYWINNPIRGLEFPNVFPYSFSCIFFDVLCNGLV